MAIDTQYNVTLPNSEWPNWSASVCKAVKVYLWMVDKTTTEYLGEDGIWYGVVLSGGEVNFNYIAKDLNLSWSTVQRYIKVLEKEGKIRRVRDDKHKGYSYEVIGSWKLAHKRDEDGTVTVTVNGKKVKGTAKNPETEEAWQTFTSSIWGNYQKATSPEEKKVWKEKYEKALEDYEVWKQGQTGATEPTEEKDDVRKPGTATTVEEWFDEFDTFLGLIGKNEDNPEKKAFWEEQYVYSHTNFDAWCEAHPELVEEYHKTHPGVCFGGVEEHFENVDDDVPNMEPWEAGIRDWNTDSNGHSAEEIRQAINKVLDTPKQREYYAKEFKRDPKSPTREKFVHKLVDDGLGRKRKKTEAPAPNTTASSIAPVTAPVPKSASETPKDKERKLQEDVWKYERDIRDLQTRIGKASTVVEELRLKKQLAGLEDNYAAFKRLLSVEAHHA